MKIFKAFLGNTSGATAIEYAMIAAGISIMIVAAARSIGSNITTLYINKVSGNLT
jgi:pilus assembly protein Flp/PilA